VEEFQIALWLRTLIVLKPLLKQEGHHGANGAACAPCETGYYKDWAGPGECVSCPAGTYKNWTGPGECSACPAGSFCAGGVALASPCPANSATPSGAAYVSECACEVETLSK
jgi:hypothetical protein